MKIRNILLTSAAILCCTASMSGTALLSHTWVSGANGNDNNPCTRLSPCATFEVAVNKTSLGGMISVADPGDFGPVVLGQSITIDGANTGNITFGSGDGIYVDPGSPTATIVLRNLTINGVGQGTNAVHFLHMGTLIIDNCLFEGFTTSGVLVDNSGLKQNAVIKNTTIVGSYAGVSADVSSAVALDHVVIQGSTEFGIIANGGTIQISNSVFTQNGMAVEAQSGVISVANTVITSNQTGVSSCGNAKIRLDTNDIYDNPVAIGTCGGTYKTSGTNRTSGTIFATAAEVSNSVLF